MQVTQEVRKPWRSEIKGAKLEGYVGCWGVPTSGFPDSRALIETAAIIYDLKATVSVSDMAGAIDKLGRKQRRRLARKNLRKVLVVANRGPAAVIRSEPIVEAAEPGQQSVPG